MTITRMCVCACELVTCESLYPRGHCLWVKTALSVASLICRNYVSQSARSQSHTYIDSLSSWFFLFFHLLFSSMCFFFSQETGVVVASGWLAVRVCVYIFYVCDPSDGATILSRHSSEELPSQLQGEQRDAIAFVTCHIVKGVSNARVIRRTRHSHLPRPATVTQIFLVSHPPSCLRVPRDAVAVWAS